jgi:hypothetical protein
MCAGLPGIDRQISLGSADVSRDQHVLRSKLWLDVLTSKVGLTDSGLRLQRFGTARERYWLTLVGALLCNVMTGAMRHIVPLLTGENCARKIGDCASHDSRIGHEIV